MSNTIYYKFKDDDQLYKSKHPCTRHLNDNDVWLSTINRIIPIDQEFQNLEYMEKGTLKYSKDQVEWMEYRVTGCSDELREKYSKILLNSSLGYYLNMVDGTAVYRFTNDEPYRRMMFIFQIMRYTEESPQDVVRFFGMPSSKNLTNDQILAALSAYIACHGNSNHAAFYPASLLKGLFSYLPQVYEAMLSDDCKPVGDSENWNKFNGTAVVKERFNHSGDPAKSNSFYYSNQHFNTVPNIIKYFTAEVEAA